MKNIFSAFVCSLSCLDELFVYLRFKMGLSVLKVALGSFKLSHSVVTFLS